MIQRRAATVEMADKENKVGQRNRPKPSRIPRPVSRARSKPLQPQNSVSQPSLPPPSPPPPPLSLPSPPPPLPPLSLPSSPPHTRVSHTPSKVKPVPDFARLHKTFQEKITKAKDKKVLTEFKTFYLTPSSGKRIMKHTTQPVQQERKREGTVEVEYPSQPPPDVCFDEISGPLVQGLPPALPFSPRQQIRLSVYSKTERALQRLLQSSSVVKQGVAPEGKSGQFSEMLQRLVQTTVSSIRTVSRCPEARELGLEAVKVKLESQLEEQDEEGLPAPESPPHLLHSPPTFTRPRPPLPSNTADSAPPISVYTTEPELCAILWNSNNSPDNGRPSCPVARLLDQCYFFPVPNVVCRD